MSITSDKTFSKFLNSYKCLFLKVDQKSKNKSI